LPPDGQLAGSGNNAIFRNIAANRVLVRLASAEDIIMEYLENSPLITNRVARGLTGIRSENSMKVVFWRLRDRNLIRQVPGRSGFASAWEKRPKAGQKKATSK
jgi:ATP-dependent DNA helicase RecG